MADPNLYATFYVQGTKHCLLRNDQDQEILITEAAAGDVAIMLSDFCHDADLAEFVADQWRGRASELEEFPEDDEPEEDDELEDQTQVDLGGGMVVPLAELLEDDE